jgi:tetratricopeptide (TPR) repeat protein
MGVYTFIALIAFGSLSQHQFELDDLAYLKDLDQISQGPSAIFSSDRHLPGRPVTDLSLLLIQTISPNNPAVFHIAVVLCHLIATILLTFTFYKTGLSQELSLIGGLFFLINLSHFRAIQWISCLAYPLALSLGCLGLLFYIAYQKRTQKTYYIISLCGFVLALLSHPAAITFACFAFYITWQNKQPLRPAFGISVLSFIFLIGLLKLFPHVPQAEHVTAAFQWSIIGFLQHGLWYLGRLWTTTLILFPGLNGIQTVDLIFGTLALLGVGLLWHQKKCPIAHWGIWMLMGLAAFITNPNQTHFESGPSRHLYFASAGSAVLLAWICQALSLKVSQLFKQSWLPKISLILLIAIITSLSVAGLKKSETFAYIISARTYLVTNQLEKATHLFEKAVAISPEHVSSAMYERFPIANLAHGKFLNDSLHQALAHYPDNALIVATRMVYGFQSNTVNHQYLTTRVVKFSQKKPQKVQKFIAIALLNLGFFYTTQAQYASAETLYQGALKVQAIYPTASIHLSQVYLKQNKIDAARQLLHKTITHFPTNVEALQTLADLYHKEKDWAQTEHLYKRILIQEPHSTNILFKLGYIYMSHQRYSEARPLFETLTQETPKSWQSFAYLGQCLHAEGNSNAAIRAYQHALRLNPDQPELQRLLKQLAP